MEFYGDPWISGVKFDRCFPALHTVGSSEGFLEALVIAVACMETQALEMGATAVFGLTLEVDPFVGGVSVSASGTPAVVHGYRTAQ